MIAHHYRFEKIQVWLVSGELIRAKTLSLNMQKNNTLKNLNMQR